MAKRATILGVGFALFVLLASPASAVTIDITDDFTKAGFDIDYSLTYNAAGSAPYAAIFRIADSTIASALVNDPWSITAVYFKLFEGSSAITLSNIAGYTWVDLGNGYAGYLFSTPFLLGAGNDLTLAFTFSDGSSTLRTDNVGFKVSYLGGPKTNGGAYTGQLSSSLTVPEPGTVALLGTGLLGVFMFRRFRK